MAKKSPTPAPSGAPAAAKPSEVFLEVLSQAVGEDAAQAVLEDYQRIDALATNSASKAMYNSQRKGMKQILAHLGVDDAVCRGIHRELFPPKERPAKKTAEDDGADE